MVTATGTRNMPELAGRYRNFPEDVGTLQELTTSNKKRQSLIPSTLSLPEFVARFLQACRLSPKELSD